jgi:hypothetical protein
VSGGRLRAEAGPHPDWVRAEKHPATVFLHPVGPAAPAASEPVRLARPNSIRPTPGRRGTVVLVARWPGWLGPCQETSCRAPGRSSPHPTIACARAEPPVPLEGRGAATVARPPTVRSGSREDHPKAARRQELGSAHSMTRRQADPTAARLHPSTAPSRLTRDFELKSLARRMRLPDPHETAERGLGRSHRTRISIFLRESCVVLTGTGELPGEGP